MPPRRKGKKVPPKKKATKTVAPIETKYKLPSGTVYYEPLSPHYWDQFPLPVNPSFWRSYMDEIWSDSDMTDSEDEKQMAGPSSARKAPLSDDKVKVDSEGNQANANSASNDKDAAEKETKPESKSKNGAKIGEILTPAVNAAVHRILDGTPIEEVLAAFDTESAAEKTSSPPSPRPGHSKLTNSALVSLPICENCSLPRLQHARAGINMQPLPDPKAQYCANEPPIILTNHDVHGNAFPGFKPKPGAVPPVAPPAPKPLPVPKSKPSPPTSSPSSPTLAPSSQLQSQLEYPQIRTPQVRCPNDCGQYKTVTAMARHLEACMLGKGRKAGREARERIGKEAGTGSGHASASANGNAGGASRAGSPGPAAGKDAKEGKEGSAEVNGVGVGESFAGSQASSSTGKRKSEDDDGKTGKKAKRSKDKQ